MAEGTQPASNGTRLDAKIEAVLFYKAEPMKKAALARAFGVEPEELDDAFAALRENLSGRGIALTETDSEVQLTTSPEHAESVEEFRKDELSRDIGRAGAETLAIIFYRGPLSRSEIDSIRGVNSTFILRNLMIRGLIERTPHPSDQRSYQYGITTALLTHLGITKREELPQFSEIMNALDTYEQFQKEQAGNEEPQEAAHNET